MLNRREFVLGLGATGLLTALPGVSFAAAGPGTRVLVVLLRGAMDGLDALRPYADPNYARLRGALADANNIGHKLDGTFALHPSLGFASELYQNKQLLPVLAVAPPYRQRSHFDAQDCLENGTGTPSGARDGWMDRCVRALPGSEGLALAAVMPLIFRGGGAVSNWSPPLPEAADAALLQRLQPLYAADAALAENFAHALSGDEEAMPAMAGMNTPRGGGTLVAMMTAAATFMAKPDGPRVAFVEDTGWDSHRGQAAQLTRKLAELDAALKAFHAGATTIWPQTVVMVATEFGRTAAVNGTGGTDHGTGGTMLLTGGAVNGGRIAGTWPGLANSDLNDGRDLRTTTDMRSVFKAVAQQHLGVAESALETLVFPDSRAATPLDGLLLARRNA
ncbi:MAG TPA: DUF1501 domain-containing protein [Arenimonas sp.]|uniref:DUF1501 domain-containing protein n=1 Tax=Arenimonas sp. TaxID=1872635 RepID=UPI002C15A2DB|nr:DUF1501 domain-containing protein [Arenimonas sp.]HMB57611.1 DUF1501 domain-containing protein [Arenimonas sp.]